ncbi:NADH-quinone oxidoreductase subunit E [Candidatus Izimaplasma bacterium HR1]|uniref:NADH-quinone oxidoreductase subunit NuoE family protein n=1 Tax=Candidatus Izimoplasma sp. HR1 TaxID=1541959 RepID=UPI0004F8CDBC|nr:NADH-quinone oxidoreductase subunit E [Candidatus Izimaplasma bacterium HR1]
MILSEVLKKYPQQKDYLLEILIDVDKMKDDHYVSESEISRIADYLGTKESHICSVMSFYTLLSTEPRGKYIIQICKDVPCYLNDTFNVVDTVCDFLGVDMGGTTEDNLFSVEFTACIGCCDDAPAMRINDTTYNGLSKGKVITILEGYKEDIK